jgi:hypothetical protein
MRTLRGSVRVALFTALGALVAARADAQLLVAVTQGDPPAIAHAELAYAVGAGAPVTWLSLRVQRGPVALVAALPKDAVAEPALDAWFKALEITASPNVLLPRDATDCGRDDSFVHVSWPRSSSTAATELLLATPEDVTAALDEQGLTLDGELPPAARYLLWSWPASDHEQTTRTLRVLGGAAPLTFTPGAPFPVLVNSITRGASSYADELGTDQLKVTFLAGDLADSDYEERLREWLDRRPEPLLEMRARGPLFDWSIYDDQVSLAPLVRSYAVRAGQELSRLDVDACSDQLRALRDPEAPEASACGDARDASLALAAAGSELATLQRFAISAGVGLSLSDARDGGDPSTPVVRAKLLDDSACGSAPWPPMPLYPTPTENDGSAGKTSGNTTVIVQGSVATDETQPPEVGCGASPEPQEGYYGDDGSDGSSDDVDCSSDTSSSSESDSSDSCSGDSSSSSSDSRSDSCSGDSSSSSSDSSSDSCSGDSSSSSSDSSSDSGCSGGSDESSSYDGDTCTGSAAPGAERTQRAQAGLSGAPRSARPRRLKTSLWTLGFAALLFPIRRRKRRLVAAG